jgi:integrase
LENKKPDAAVFSPRTAMAERRAAQRANRVAKMTPSRIAREKANEAKPSRYREFYNKDSYRLAVKYAIVKGNKVLPDDEKIPHWTPYQLRHSAATAMENESGLDEAQTLLDHSSANTTKRYTHGRLQKLKELARNRKDIFAEQEG